MSSLTVNNQTNKFSHEDYLNYIKPKKKQMENKNTLGLNSWVLKQAELRNELDHRLEPTHSIETQTSRWLDETNLKVKNIIIIEGRTFSGLKHGLSKDNLQITVLETKRT